MIRNFIKAVLRKFKFSSSLLDLFFIRKFYLNEKGWTQSRAMHKPVDKKGESLPWFTYAAIAFIEERLNPTFKVFEFGSGNSTLFFGKRAESVISVESDLNFFDHIKPRIQVLENVEYAHKRADNGEFSSSISAYQQTFDIVIIDGADRVNCSKNALPALKADGIIIWDNSDRTEYEEGYQFLIDNQFRRIDFTGHGPIGYKEWSTSVFYRGTNCFGI